MAGQKEIIRCDWALNEVNHYYHDNEWCVPSHDDRYIFEMLILEGMQAGLSWVTILRKRDAFRKAFDNFDASLVAKYDEKKIAELMENEGIIRNKLKINAAINNAKLFLKIAKEYGSFSKFIWSYTNGVQIKNKWTKSDEIPARTELSDKISKDLKKLGFKFTGTVIIYSFMQAIGMVNDHLTICDCHSRD